MRFNSWGPRVLQDWSTFKLLLRHDQFGRSSNYSRCKASNKSWRQSHQFQVAGPQHIPTFWDEKTSEQGGWKLPMDSRFIPGLYQPSPHLWAHVALHVTPICSEHRRWQTENWSLLPRWHSWPSIRGTGSVDWRSEAVFAAWHSSSSRPTECKWCLQCQPWFQPKHSHPPKGCASWRGKIDREKRIGSLRPNATRFTRFKVASS